MVRVLEGESVCEANGKMGDLKIMLTATIRGVCGKRKKFPASLFWHLITSIQPPGWNRQKRNLTQFSPSSPYLFSLPPLGSETVLQNKPGYGLFRKPKEELLSFRMLSFSIPIAYSYKNNILCTYFAYENWNADRRPQEASILADDTFIKQQFLGLIIWLQSQWMPWRKPQVVWEDLMESWFSHQAQESCQMKPERRRVQWVKRR